MDGLRLYGMDEAGETVFAEDLPSEARTQVRGVAEQRLQRWHGVEVWDGPLCVVRLTRKRRALG